MDRFWLKICVLFCVVAVNLPIVLSVLKNEGRSWYLIFISMGTIVHVCVILLVLWYSAKEWLYPKKKFASGVPRGKSVGIVIPCYTESRKMLVDTINSSIESIRDTREKYSIQPFMFLVCDGIKTGYKNDDSTYNYVKQSLPCSSYSTREYQSWNGQTVRIECGFGFSGDIPYMVILKHTNQGKKDSLIMVRELINSLKSSQKGDLEVEFERMLHAIGIVTLDFIVGTDAGTIFTNSTITTLYEEITSDDKILGVSGLVKPYPGTRGSLWNWLYFYQGLTRLGQSHMGKVTCLPGCIQIFRLDECTLGEPLRLFKEKPKNNLRKEIMAYLGEDRRYTCLCLYSNPSMITKINTNAVVYTDVPTTWKVFLSQRRRWFLSATANNYEDTVAKQLNWLSRLFAFSQLWNNIFMLVSVICVYRLFYLILIGENPSIKFALFIICYKVILAWKFSNTWFEFVYNTAGIAAFMLVCPLLNLIIMFYAICTMDNFEWGLTQKTETRDSFV